MILKPVYLSHSLVVFKVSGLHYTFKNYCEIQRASVYVGYIYQNYVRN